jgi:hypothetical protein
MYYRKNNEIGYGSTEVDYKSLNKGLLPLYDPDFVKRVTEK